MTQTNDLKRAMVLSGGGAYGAYEVGVMKALFEGKSCATDYKPLDPDIFTGTSVGAVNASVLVSQSEAGPIPAIEHLQDIWLNQITDRSGQCGNGIYRFRVNPLRYIRDPDCFLRQPLRPVVELTKDGAFLSRDFFRRGLNFLTSSGTLEQRTLELFDFSSFIEVEPFKRLLRRIIDLERVRKSQKALRVATTNWQTGEVNIFENKELTDEVGYQAILSSTAIPGFFPPHLIRGVPHIDGGVVMNTPLRCSIDAGANVIHAIYLDPNIKDIPLERLEDTIDTLEKVYSIMSATIAGEDAKTAQWVNDGLETIDRVTRGETLSDPDAIAFVRVASQIEKKIRAGSPYRLLTVHQYRPRDLLGGSLGLLDFRYPVISRLVERGFNDAVKHDCEENDCILPGKTSAKGAAQEG